MPSSQIRNMSFVRNALLQKRLLYSTDLKKKLHNSPNIPKQRDFTTLRWSQDKVSDVVSKIQDEVMSVPKLRRASKSKLKTKTYPKACLGRTIVPSQLREHACRFPTHVQAYLNINKKEAFIKCSVKYYSSNCIVLISIV